MTDESRSIGGRAAQLLSRFTGELPQTIIGNLVAHGNNICNDVRVDYFGGATFTTTERQNHHRGYSIGNYIHVDIKDEIQGDFQSYLLSDPVYMHEYGHTLQSQFYGFAYIFPAALSLGNFLFGGESDPWKADKRTSFFVEKGANTRASIYFQQYGINWTKTKYYSTDPLHRWKPISADYPIYSNSNSWLYVSHFYPFY